MERKKLVISIILSIAILIVLLALSYFIPKYDQAQAKGSPTPFIVKAHGFGYPLFYGEVYHGDYFGTEFLIIPFIINLIYFYLISCSLVFIINKFWKK